MYKSETIGKLAEALCKAQAEIKVAEMNATNPFLHNKYADLGSIIAAIRPALTANGLSFAQMVGGQGGVISLDTILMHTSGEFVGEIVTMMVDDEKGRSRAQSMGAIITYMRRYALAALVGVYADEDTDGNSGSGSSGQTKAVNKPQPQAQNKPQPQAQNKPQPQTNGKQADGELPSPAAWARYTELEERALDMGIMPPDYNDETITIGELRKIYATLEKAIADATKSEGL